MKKLLFFCMCTFLSYQLIAQPFEKKQITDFNYDSRGAAFPKYPIGFTQSQVSHIFYEAHVGNTANIMMMSYNSYTDSFFNPVPITSNNYLNINPIAEAFYNWDNEINLIWQTNENGNWDIALKTLSDTGWSSKSFIVNSASDETNPIYILKDYSPSSHGFEIDILYEKENSIYLYQQRDSIVNNEVVLKGNDTVCYFQAAGVYFSQYFSTPRGLYVTASYKPNDSTSIIVYRYKAYNDTIWSQIFTAYDSGYCENPKFFHWFNNYPILSFERKLNGRTQIFIIPGMGYLGQNQSAVSLIDNEFVNTSDLNAYWFGIVTRNENFDINGPFAYKLISNDSAFIVNTPHNYFMSQLFFTKITDTRIGLGNLGLSLENAISYIIWEDSTNGKINLFGIKRTDPIGDVNDKINSSNFVLYQNYPNPFNPKTVIQYNLLSRDYVSLKVFDVLGNEIAVLVNEEKEAGEFKITFDGSNLASGIYIYRLAVGNKHFSRKMILLK